MRLKDEARYLHITEEDILMEEWKDIMGYEGVYMVSNMGRVKNRKGLLRPRKKTDGYQMVTLKDKNGKEKSYRIHRLVAEHFIPNEENKPYVDHLDTNKANNKHFNLRWVTQQENMNNNKTKEKKIRPVIVLGRNGVILSSGLGVKETAKKINICERILLDLLKSNKPYIASIMTNDDNMNLLRLLNGIRAYYICEYDKEEALKEIAEDKTDYSYCIGDLVCIYPNDKISDPMSSEKLAKELGIGKTLVRRIRDSKKPYKAPSKSNGISKEHLDHLKTLEGIRIMYYEDYLKEQND